MKIQTENIKPSIITTINKIREELLERGLSEDMIITLIHNKLPTSSKIGKGRIKAVLTAVLQLENEINNNIKQRKKNE